MDTFDADRSNPASCSGPSRAGAGPGRDEITVLFARALDGDEDAEDELGARAFPAVRGLPSPAAPGALDALMALHRADYEQALNASPVPARSPAEQARIDQTDARSRERFWARLAAVTDLDLRPGSGPADLEAGTGDSAGA